MTAASCLAAIVLLIDVSASVPQRLYVAQRDGTAAAFEAPQLLRTIEDNGGIAVMVMEFSYVAMVRVGWTRVLDRRDAAGFVQTIRGLTRSSHHGNTAIGHAMARAMQELAAAPCEPAFRLIDIATDGAETAAHSLEARDVRDAALTDGISVNAIAFPPFIGQASDSEAAASLAETEAWLRENVATGFVRVASEVTGFEQAFRHKVVQELTALRPARP